MTILLRYLIVLLFQSAKVIQKVEFFFGRGMKELRKLRLDLWEKKIEKGRYQQKEDKELPLRMLSRR
jgi:hypothetical protein